MTSYVRKALVRLSDTDGDGEDTGTEDGGNSDSTTPPRRHRLVRQRAVEDDADLELSDSDNDSPPHTQDATTRHPAQGAQAR